MGDFEGKVALITGGGSGIGRATAVAFARAGARVCVFGTTRAGLEETKKLVEKNGGECLVVVGDVSKSADCKRFVSEAKRKFGRIDALVNCAGIEGPVASIDKLDEKDWQRVLDVDLTGTMLMCKHAAPQMREGAIVNMSSSLGLYPITEIASYCVAKAGVLMFSRVLALELAPRVRVNCICPGPIDTPMLRRFAAPEELRSIERGHHMRRLGKPEEVADAILFLCSKRASYITGAVLSVGAQV